MGLELAYPRVTVAAAAAHQAGRAVPDRCAGQARSPAGAVTGTSTPIVRSCSEIEAQESAGHEMLVSYATETFSFLRENRRASG